MAIKTLRKLKSIPLKTQRTRSVRFGETKSYTVLLETISTVMGIYVINLKLFFFFRVVDTNKIQSIKNLLSL